MESIDDLLERFLAQLNGKGADALKASEGIYQFHLTGEDGGDWALVLRNGEASITPVTHADPGVTVTLSAQDFKELATQRLNAMSAFMSGKLKVTGNMGLAMKLSGLL